MRICPVMLFHSNVGATGGIDCDCPLLPDPSRVPPALMAQLNGTCYVEMFLQMALFKCPTGSLGM